MQRFRRASLAAASDLFRHHQHNGGDDGADGERDNKKGVNTTKDSDGVLERFEKLKHDPLTIRVRR